RPGHSDAVCVGGCGDAAQPAGRPSQLQGASGVASAMPLTRHPGPASLHDPLRAALRAGHSLPSTTRSTTAATHAHSTTTPKNRKTTHPKTKAPDNTLDTAPLLQG